MSATPAGRGATVLVVEDEADLRHLIEFNLRQAGYQTSEAATGKQAVERAQRVRPQLVLLDLNLPDISGIEVCRRLKADGSTSHIPVLMLTARGAEEERVAGFEVGADDYVTKPFHLRELMWRVAVVLRRHPRAASQATLVCGPITLDAAGVVVRVDGVIVPLALLEFRLLAFLMEAEGGVRTRAELYQHVWGYPSNSDSRTIDTHVKRLREKLGAAGERIETVRAVGYRVRT